MATTQADDVRQKTVEAVAGDDYDAVYVSVLRDDGTFDTFVLGPTEDDSDVLAEIRDAAACFTARAQDDRLAEGMFARDEDDELFMELIDRSMDDVTERQGDMTDQDSVMDYGAKDRAVLAAGTALASKVNPLAGLLG